MRSLGILVNNLNGHHIVVTADHGFLFTGNGPCRDRQEQAEGQARTCTIPAKKGYLIGSILLDRCGMRYAGKELMTAKADGNMEFWIPKGSNLFHFVGGARFVHGGAMPQEIVVPVLTVKHIRGKSAQEHEDESQ